LQIEERLSELSELERGYLAGLLDCAGSFQIRSHKVKGKKYYVPRIVIKRYSGAWEEFIESLGFGRFYYKQDKCQHQTAWYMYRSKEIAVLLEFITPHLRIRKERALVILNWLNEGTSKAPPLDYAVLQRRRSLL